YLDKWDSFAVGRYAEVKSILEDPETFCSSGGVGLTNFHKEKPWRPPSMLLETDPPEHTRNRDRKSVVEGDSVELGGRGDVSSRRRHTMFSRDWSSDVCSSDLTSTNGIPSPSAVMPRSRAFSRIRKPSVRAAAWVSPTSTRKNRGGRPACCWKPIRPSTPAI